MSEGSLALDLRVPEMPAVSGTVFFSKDDRTAFAVEKVNLTPMLVRAFEADPTLSRGEGFAMFLEKLRSTRFFSGISGPFSDARSLVSDYPDPRLEEAIQAYDLIHSIVSRNPNHSSGNDLKPKWFFSPDDVMTFKREFMRRFGEAVEVGGNERSLMSQVPERGPGRPSAPDL